MSTWKPTITKYVHDIRLWVNLLKTQIRESENILSNLIPNHLHLMDGLGQREYRSWIMQFVYTTILLCVQQLMAFWSNETTVTQFKHIPLTSTCKADVVPLGTFKYVLYYFYIFTVYWKKMSVWDLRLPQSWCCRFAYYGILHLFEWKSFTNVSKNHNAFIFSIE